MVFGLRRFEVPSYGEFSAIDRFLRVSLFERNELLASSKETVGVLCFPASDKPKTNRPSTVSRRSYSRRRKSLISAEGADVRYF